jgi:hypothetical protein
LGVEFRIYSAPGSLISALSWSDNDAERKSQNSKIEIELGSDGPRKGAADLPINSDGIRNEFQYLKIVP